MAFPGVEELTGMIEPIAAAHGMDVENVRTVAAGKKSQVIIALDSADHPTLDELEVISNEISELFDAREDAGEVNFGAGYTLEVTTPGVDMPLTQPRHWKRNRGHLVILDGQSYRIGALDDVQENLIVVRAGAKQPSVEVRKVSGLPQAVVEIEFKNPPAAEMELVDLGFDQASELAHD